MANENNNDTYVYKKPRATADTPLTPTEQKFVTEYIRTGSIIDSVKSLGLDTKAPAAYGRQLLNKPNINAEIQRTMEKLKAETVATAEEVMSYFTSVMRGELKDQFGLEASLAERTRAAQELAKRTIDIENRKKGEPDQTLEIKIDWSRDIEE